MGINILYTISCDGCHFEQEIKVNWSIQSIDSHQGAMDIWSPGIQAGWLQISRKDNTPLLFHGSSCYKKWLADNGRQSELEDFDEAVWIA